MDWNFIFGVCVSVILIQFMVQMSVGCLREEKEALLEFKASINETQNRHLLLPSWDDEDDPENDCCNWEGVKCSNSTKRIIELSLSYLRINIFENSDAEFREWFLDATTFFPLKELRFLDLSSNYFRGCSQLYRLENLEVLDLGANSFDYSILPCFSAISTLKNLSLRGNRMDGLFPNQGCKQLSRLQNLEVLDLSWNYFNSSILPCLSAISTLKQLSLQGNSLGGSFPIQGSRQLSRFENLEVLDLGLNSFNNSILPCLSAISTLKQLSLLGNSLNGSLPIQEITRLRNLEALDISINNFQGPLSFKELATLGNMVTLDLGYNGFNNVSSIEVMASLNALSLGNNQLSYSSISEAVRGCTPALGQSSLSFGNSGPSLLESQDFLQLMM